MLGAPTATSTTSAAAVGLGPAFSIDSRLSGTPSTQAGHPNATKTRVSASGMVQSFTSNAFTQSSSMSCSSFGELLEKVRFSFYFARSFLWLCAWAFDVIFKKPLPVGTQLASFIYSCL
jgi:hypothetical protein